ncbi:MAG: hypothetical protein MUP13_05585, partial [Thermoanaerobaculales bacterium]|nr:hypothetical protein [Thermoanaerobaculales bacterium]
MAADLTEALESLDLAVARAAGVVGDEAVHPFARISLNARRRTGFLVQQAARLLAGTGGPGRVPVVVDL